MRFSFHCWDCAATKFYDSLELAKEGMTNHANRLRHKHFDIAKNSMTIEVVDFVEE